MNTRLYENYKVQLANGQPAAATAALVQFIESFTSFESKTTWVRWYLGNERWEHRIRHEIYEHLIFPVLLQGYRTEDLWCLRWLIRTIANIYTREHLWAQIDRKAELDLREELVARVPEDARARRELVDCFIEAFRNMAQEWPEGILQGQDGATTSQCLEILANTQRALQLDVEQRHHAFIQDFADKVRIYQQSMSHEP